LLIRNNNSKALNANNEILLTCETLQSATMLFVVFMLLANFALFDVHGSVHHNTNLTEMTNKMQLCRTIYYSNVPLLLNMFRAILSLIIRSF